MKELLLYAIRPGNTERWQEELLTCTTDPARIEKITKLSTRDGWHSHRTATYTPGELPDFTKTIQK